MLFQWYLRVGRAAGWCVPSGGIQRRQRLPKYIRACNHHKIPLCSTIIFTCFSLQTLADFIVLTKTPSSQRPSPMLHSSAMLSQPVQAQHPECRRAESSSAGTNPSAVWSSWAFGMLVCRGWFNQQAWQWWLFRSRGPCCCFRLYWSQKLNATCWVVQDRRPATFVDKRTSSLLLSATADSLLNIFKVEWKCISAITAFDIRYISRQVHFEFEHCMPN